MSNLRNEDWSDIYLEISVCGWDFYGVHFPGLKQIQSMSREKLYSSENHNSYIKYNFNMWDIETQFWITGKHEGVDITGDDVSIKVWYK